MGTKFNKAKNIYESIENFVQNLLIPGAGDSWLIWAFIALCIFTAGTNIILTLAWTFAIGTIVEGLSAINAFILAFKEPKNPAKWLSAIGKTSATIGCALMATACFGVALGSLAATWIVPACFATGFALTFIGSLFNAAIANKELKEANKKIAELNTEIKNIADDSDESKAKKAPLEAQLQQAILDKKVATTKLTVSTILTIGCAVALFAVVGGLFLPALIPALAVACPFLSPILMGFGVAAAVALTIGRIASFALPIIVKARHKAEFDIKNEASINTEDNKADEKTLLLEPEKISTATKIKNWFKNEPEMIRRAAKVIGHGIFEGNSAYQIPTVDSSEKREDDAKYRANGTP